MRRVRDAHRDRLFKTWGSVLFLGLISVISACESIDNLLEVELPGEIAEINLDNPDNAALLVRSAQASFECGFGDHIIWFGYWTGEFMNVTTSSPSQLMSTRSSGYSLTYADPCGTGTGPTWTPFQVSRVQAENVLERMEGWLSQGFDIGDVDFLSAQANLYAGYSYLILSEEFCEVAFDSGPILPRADGFRLAEERFTSAIQQASQTSDPGAIAVLTAAQIGRARARLNLGDASGVVADASLVPAGFEYFATYDLTPNRRQNRIASLFEGKSLSVPPQSRNLEVGGVADPRVIAINTGEIASDGVGEFWDQVKYADLASEIPLATWREAQLMIAEVSGGQTAVDIINALRATHSLPAFTSTVPADIEAQVHEERRRELWMQGHRMGDMLRWNEPFPSGFDHRGRAYNEENTCMALPNLEKLGNPNIT